MTKQSMEYRFFKKFAPQINGIIVPPNAVGEFGWEGHFDIKPQDGIDFIKQEITKALQSYSQEMGKLLKDEEINSEFDTQKELDEYVEYIDNRNELRQSQRQEKLKVDKKWGIK